MRVDPIGLIGGINLYRYCLNDPINMMDPEGLLVIGGAYSGSGGAGGVGDVSVGIVASGKDVGAIIDLSGSIGPQLAADAGPAVIVAPFAKRIQDISGPSTDIQLRFTYQLTISIPQTGDILKGLNFSFDFSPGFDFGIGYGGGYTWIIPFYKKDNPCSE